MSERPGPELARQLGQIRRRRWALWGVFLSYLPAVWLGSRLAGGNAAGLAVTAVWLVAAAVAGVRVSTSRCPRCGQLFHMEGLMTSWSGRCVHCGLGLRDAGAGS